MPFPNAETKASIDRMNDEQLIDVISHAPTDILEGIRGLTGDRSEAVQEAIRQRARELSRQP